jgi:fumarylacetoacetase
VSPPTGDPQPATGGATHASWVAGAPGSLFDVDCLPYGSFRVGSGPAALGVRIGEQVLAVGPLAQATGAPFASALAGPNLDSLLAAGPAVWAEVRGWLAGILTDGSYRESVSPHLVPLDRVTLHLPFTVADYVDFYSSEHHATNVGRIFRPDGAALPAAWKHLPIGYHGRAGTVVVSGTAIRRPSGLRRAGAEVGFGPCLRLDIEAEVGFVVGAGSMLGQPVSAASFDQHVFGVCLVNDWSARDIQAFEYVPLGPFLGKSFATSISGWVLPLAALEAARVTAPVQEPAPAAYLTGGADWGLDLALEVEWNGEIVARPPFAQMYWTPAQQLAHLTVNGASLRPGDLYASGTVSGPGRAERGSFLELSWGGRDAVLVAGEERTFLADGDTVVLRATAPSGGGGRIGLGEVSGTVLPALAT